MLKRPRTDGTELDQPAGPKLPGAYDQQAHHQSAGAGAGMGGGYSTEIMFPCVKLRGLPFDVTEQDIKMFLELEPIDIVMLKRDGRFSGEAFVVLSSAMHVEAAMTKHKMYLGSRFVEVFACRKMDYYRAVATEFGMSSTGAARRGYDMGGMGGMGGGYGHGHGMMDPMAGYNPMMQGYHGGGYNGGMGMGGGYDAHHGGMAGMAPQAGYGAAYGAPAGPGMASGGTNWIKLRGLPFSVMVEDIIEFFADPALGLNRLDPAKVRLWNDNGRPTGMALVEFPSPQEATMALAKNKAVMGTRYIELFPATRGDLEKFSARTGEQIV